MWRRLLAAAIPALAISSAGCDAGALGPLGPSTEPAQTVPGEIAFELAGPGGAVIVVPVRINGEGPFDFVVDTGATFTCVDQELAEKLQLPEQPGSVGFGAGIGGSGTVRIVEIDTLEVGTARAEETMAAVIDLSSIKESGIVVRGLIGLNFLKAYRVTFDFERNVLRLDQSQPQ